MLETLSTAHDVYIIRKISFRIMMRFGGPKSLIDMM
jgi:hypothetical protein